MSHSRKSQESSHRLLDNVDEDERELEESSKFPFRQAIRRLSAVFKLLWFCMVCLIMGFAGGAYFNNTKFLTSTPFALGSKVCKEPSLRREWRSLGTGEKTSYIEAVKCLETLPSQLNLNQTLYDDFPWVHIHFGEYSHDAAPFLAWHRYFIHIYEQNLKERCGYGGHLAYWDWTLDWENITQSPIWDTTTGFGGNGNVSQGLPVFKAHCVTEGPFAGLQVPYFEHSYQPHCLLRGFDENLSDFRTELKPESLDKLLLSAAYDDINLGLENGPHVAIPKSINGDFSLHTAPFDPVFFLHHTQLDRMWWRWQQLDLESRTTEYAGKMETNSTKEASLADIMPMGGLAPDISVSEVVSTYSDLLCYKY